MIKGKRLSTDLETQASYDTDSDDDSEIEDAHKNAEESGSSMVRAEFFQHYKKM